MQPRYSEFLCPKFQTALDVLARPWNGLVMAVLFQFGPLRFSELRKHLSAMGDRVLAARLKELEARQLIVRRVEPGPPVRVAYELSETGRGFRDVVLALAEWGDRIIKSRPAKPRPISKRVKRKRSPR
ncbi:MAG: winged helix-turn-helix transcriptional regulator [Alphaproteobacteria bacterium]